MPVGEEDGEGNLTRVLREGVHVLFYFNLKSQCRAGERTCVYLSSMRW